MGKSCHLFGSQKLVNINIIYIDNQYSIMSDDPIPTNTEELLLTTTSTPLIYDDTISTSSIQQVLFVSAGASPLETYANAETFTIVYDSSSTLEDIWELMRRKFPSSSEITRIGFAFHNHGDLTRFCNQETWFSDMDLEDARQTEFSQNAQFMFDFLREFKVTHVDFLACKTLQSEKWRKYYELIQSQLGGVIVGASEDDTGNVKYGGDWVLESTMEDIRDVYFTGGIENYTSLLNTAPYTSLNNYYYSFYTVSATTPSVMSRTIYDNAGNLIDTTNISYGGQNITDALTTMNGSGGTNPFSVGTVDRSQNKIKMDVAYSNVFTKALTSTQKTKLMSYVNTTFKEPRTIFANHYIVTVSGGSYWLALFPSAVPSKTPTITFTAGNTYIFDQSHVSNIGKPIVLTRPNMSIYTTGVTTVGTIGQSVNAYTQVIIPSTGFTDTLAYFDGFETVLLIDGSTGSYLDQSSYSIATTVTSGTGNVVVSDGKISFTGNQILNYSNSSGALSLGTNDFEITVTTNSVDGYNSIRYDLNDATPAPSTLGFALYSGGGNKQFHTFMKVGSGTTTYRVDWVSTNLNKSSLEYTFVCKRDATGLTVTVNYGSTTENCSVGYYEPSNLFSGSTLVNNKVIPPSGSSFNFGSDTSGVLRILGNNNPSFYLKKLQIKIKK